MVGLRVFFLGVFLASMAMAGEGEKQKAPADGLLAKAEALLKGAYKGEFAKTGIAGRRGVGKRGFGRGGGGETGGGAEFCFVWGGRGVGGGGGEVGAGCGGSEWGHGVGEVCVLFQK